MPRVTSNNSDDEAQLYCEKSEWQDITPIPQYDGINPIAPIFYTPEYKDATEYFRAIVKADEVSERVLQLTYDIISMNPAHYSAWQYRYRTLVALKHPLDVELELMDAFAIKFLKTYQVWHHRRLLLTALRSSAPSPLSIASKELAFIIRALSTDTKNYHTWSYRQWLLAFFDDEELWEGELPYVERLLETDVRNNSAWHHRYFVVWGRVRAEGEIDVGDVLKREIAYTKDQIALAPNNPSAWNYLRGILEHTKTPFNSLRTFVELYSTQTAPGEEDIVDLDNPKPGPGAQLPCAPALEFLADIHEEMGGEQTKKAIEIWKSLGNEYDTMRKKYWEFRVKEALSV
ncbi:protein prenylyltransferase [Cristinia sonorae]|uniref:Protein farnesyltransferase/geranylgeranyltransferase type-1 subunit alpha n=1 Tax=Cristinia sonorae TaxID=1940300 RepID=A0A8K0XRX6_9AGAR|nr:protein prenylyltransferase [Cristinia sonorae]